MEPDYHYMKVKAGAISLGIAIFIAYITHDGTGGCDGGLCVFGMIGSLLKGFLVFIISFFIIYKIIKYNKEQEW